MTSDNVIRFPDVAERIMAKIRQGSRVDQLNLYAILTGYNPLGPDDHEYIWPDEEQSRQLLKQYGLLTLVENAAYFGEQIQQLLPPRRH